MLVEWNRWEGEKTDHFGEVGGVGGDEVVVVESLREINHGS